MDMLRDPYRRCIFRDDRHCTAAPYYGTADCEWAVDKEECPEPMAAIACIEMVEEDSNVHLI